MREERIVRVDMRNTRNVFNAERRFDWRRIVREISAPLIAPVFIRIAVADMAALEKFILEQLTPIPGIEKIRSSFALKQVRYKTALPLPK